MSLLDRYTPDELRALIAIADPAQAAAILAGLEAELVDDRYFPEARTAQRPPPWPWSVWLILAGRGFGKTRTGAEWLVEEASTHPGAYAVAAPTYADARDICIEGDSGIAKVLQRRGRWEPRRMWNRSLGEVVLDNGSKLKLGSADEPDRFRGWNFSGAWCDELAAWKKPDAWTQLRLANRMGRALTIITTTPRPTRLVKQLVERESTVVVRGSTFENEANLAPEFLEEMRTTYEGTRIGRQELYAEILTDTVGALWSQELIDAARVTEIPGMRRVVVAIDPAVTSGENADDTGIIVAGVGTDGQFYVLADRTQHTSPDTWCYAAVCLLDEYRADRIVAEVNNGGDTVEALLRTIDRTIPFRKVTASRGKRVRAEPVAALYEQGRVHHLGGFPELEDQLCTWTADSPDSPDRLDALVWAITELALDRPHGRRGIVNVL